MDDLTETKLAVQLTLREVREGQMRECLRVIATMRKPTPSQRQYLALLCTEWLSAHSECSELQHKLDHADAAPIASTETFRGKAIAV